jgi:hypothetical protein
VLARTSVSNSHPHLLHAYSKIGMAGSSCAAQYKLDWFRRAKLPWHEHPMRG